MNVPTKVIEYALKSGKYFFILAVVILASNNWNIIKIQSQGFINFLWVYLLINALAVSAILYRRYSLRSTSEKCPYCKGDLRSKTVYICPNCGELKTEK